ncbi:MAG: hypothetical protein QGI60_05685 [archaeon]|jgi:hypothetical protein|nr:hypothetical protein [archaeon]
MPHKKNSKIVGGEKGFGARLDQPSELELRQQKQREARLVKVAEEEAAQKKRFATALKTVSAKAKQSLLVASTKCAQSFTKMGLKPQPAYRIAENILHESEAPGLVAIRTELTETIAEKTITAPTGSGQVVDLVVRRLTVEAINKALAKGLITKNLLMNYKPPAKPK